MIFAEAGLEMKMSPSLGNPGNGSGPKRGSWMLILTVSLAIHLVLLLVFGGRALFRKGISHVPFVAEGFQPEAPAEAVAPLPEDEPVLPEMAPADPLAHDSSVSSAPDETGSPLEAVTLTRVPDGLVAGNSAQRPALTGIGAGAGTVRADPAGPSAKAGPGPSFFGISVEPEASRVVLLLDTSNSMFERRRGGDRHKFDYGVIKKEAVGLILGLSGSSFLNVVLYEGGAVAFQDRMMPLGDGFRKRACRWITDIEEEPAVTIRERRGEAKLMEGPGTRLDTGLKLAFRFDPTVILLLTDGEANRGGPTGTGKMTETEMVSLIRESRQSQTNPAVIHVVQYLTAQARPAETSLLRAIAREGGGNLRTVEAKTLRIEALANPK